MVSFFQGFSRFSQNFLKFPMFENFIVFSRISYDFRGFSKISQNFLENPTFLFDFFSKIKAEEGDVPRCEKVHFDGGRRSATRRHFRMESRTKPPRQISFSISGFYSFLPFWALMIKAFNLASIFVVSKIKCVGGHFIYKIISKNVTDI